MKPWNYCLLWITSCLVATPWIMAQTPPADEPESDPVLEAIRKFTEHSPPNEVTVVLPPPTDSPIVEKTSDPDDVQADDEHGILVTGRPSGGAIVADDPEHDGPTEPSHAAAADEEPLGPVVRVERLQDGTAGGVGAKVELSAPFPAKPLSAPPAGWVIDVAADAPPFKRQVEIAPGSTVTLEIRPHVLSPEADGHHVFSVVEPRYTSELGYRQTDTVGAILGQSLQHHNDDARKLSAVIDELQQMLVSLPSSEPVEPEPNGSP